MRDGLRHPCAQLIAKYLMGEQRERRGQIHRTSSKFPTWYLENAWSIPRVKRSGSGKGMRV